MDEAGRGPLAGPLVVAACLLPACFDASGLDDSKRLSWSQREDLYEKVVTQARYHVEVVAAQVVDELNILRATLEGMGRCLTALGATRARVDGNQHPVGAPCPCELWVKGDGRDAAIAAASVLAKVTRDRLMKRAAAEFPGYGFEHNMGYHAPDHIAGLESLGPCPLHRRSFEPVKSMLVQPCLLLDD